ncbi:MAG: zf-HC2 domain-containing protein [Armatimonadetes bacterium]|nr:zf-HC2 domain-containing protein [Armatimonadota bacterium]
MKRGFWKSIWYIVCLTCDESSRLLSDAMDRDLTRVERTALRMHNLTCKSCKRFIDQLEFLRRAASGAVLREDRKALSPEARDRLRVSLRQASGEGD